MFNFFKKKSIPLNIKIIDETHSNSELIIEPLIKELDNYDNRKKLEKIKIEVIIPKEFNKSIYNNSNESVKNMIDLYSHSLGESNGYFCTPIISNPNCFKILVNKNILDDLQFYGTIYHEFTHIIDFNEYINNYGNPDKMDKYQKRQNFFYEFYLWTEFNAKKIGIRRLMIEYKKNEFSVAFPQLTNLFMEDVRNEKDTLRRLYYLVHFFARITECGKHYTKNNNEIYPKDFLKSYFGLRVLDLHKILEKTKSFNEFQKNRIKLKEIIDY